MLLEINEIKVILDNIARFQNHVFKTHILNLYFLITRLFK
jgi:hypothetical protein